MQLSGSLVTLTLAQIEFFQALVQTSDPNMHTHAHTHSHTHTQLQRVNLLHGVS